jgi:hypothetical protein
MGETWEVHIVSTKASLTGASLESVLSICGKHGWSPHETQIPGLPPALLRTQRHFTAGPLWFYTRDYPEDEGRVVLVLASERYMFSDLVSRDSKRRRMGEHDVATLYSLLDDALSLIDPLWAYGNPEGSYRYDQNDQAIPPTGKDVLRSLRRRKRPWIVFLGQELLGQVRESEVRSRALESRHLAHGLLLLYRKNPFG